MQIVNNLDWEKIKAYGAEHAGIEWKFSPGDAPWYNGATEALVKTTKRALNAAVGENVMTFSELQTSIFEAAQLVNQRPIGHTPTTPEDGTYLCPNDMLLGRASPRIPQGRFEERSSNKNRIDFIQSVTSAFWKRWTREVFPRLVIQPKWHTESRNLEEGDIVLVEDSDVLRGEWKMARVTETKASEDGKVRRVKVAYRTTTGMKQEIDRAVQRLILMLPAKESH
jgi:hypothetical protein